MRIMRVRFRRLLRPTVKPLLVSAGLLCTCYFAFFTSTFMKYFSIRPWSALESMCIYLFVLLSCCLLPSSFLHQHSDHHSPVSDIITKMVGLNTLAPLALVFAHAAIAVPLVNGPPTTTWPVPPVEYEIDHACPGIDITRCNVLDKSDRRYKKCVEYLKREASGAACYEHQREYGAAPWELGTWKRDAM